jgi:hypothetical protein
MKDISSAIGSYKKHYTFFGVINQLFSITLKPELLKTIPVDFAQYEHHFKQPFVIF